MDEDEYYRQRLKKHEDDQLVALVCLSLAALLVLGAIVYQALTC